MKNNKGFTLVELLAVIVILALIITIAVPGTISISNKMKQKMYESKLDFIKTAAKLYGEDHRDELADGKKTITVKELAEGNYLKKDQKKAPYIQDPRNKNNSLDNMNVTIALKNNRIYVSFDGTTSDDSSNKSEETYICKKATTLHQERCWEGAKCIEDGIQDSDYITYGKITSELTTGAAFDCDIDGDGYYNADTERFYYVSDYYDANLGSFNSNYATLIYYKNVDEYSCVYDEDSDYHGPTAAMKYLPTTTEWSNVNLYKTSRSNITYNGDDLTSNTYLSNIEYGGYAARFLTSQEVENGCEGSLTILNERSLVSKCNFLFESTSYQNSYRPYPGAYWLETPYGTDNNITVISTTGRNVSLLEYSSTAGVRPVIDVPKSSINVD